MSESWKFDWTQTQAFRVLVVFSLLISSESLPTTVKRLILPKTFVEVEFGEVFQNDSEFSLF